MKEKENKKIKKCNKNISRRSKETKKIEESYKLGIKYYEEINNK